MHLLEQYYIRFTFERVCLLGFKSRKIMRIRFREHQKM